MTQKKFLNHKISYLICICCCLIFFVGSMFAYHDVQIAQGAGLYLAGKYGFSDRVPFDVLMDSIGGLGLLICILCPTLLLKKRTPDALLRFITVFLAFIPLINPGSLVHIASHISNWQIRETFLNGNFFQEFIIILSEPMKLLVWEIPLLILALMIHKNHFEHKVKSWQKIMFVISAICMILYLLFPGFQEYSLFLMHYPIIIVLFYESEQLWENNLSADKRTPLCISWIIYGICGLRGIFRIIDLLQNTHL